MAKVQESKVETIVAQETMSSQEIRDQIITLYNQISMFYMDESILMTKVYHEGLWREWSKNGHKFSTFEEWAQGDLGLEYRKAMYFIKIGDMINSFSLDRGELSVIGWAKAKELARILNYENIDEWMSKAGELSLKELQKEVSQSLKGSTVDNAPSSITTISLKCNESAARIILDAISCAKDFGEIDDLCDAVEYICLNWMESAGQTPKEAQLADHLKFLREVYQVKVSVDNTDEVADMPKDSSVPILGVDTLTPSFKTGTPIDDYMGNETQLDTLDDLSDLFSDVGEN